jgi:hypothetical protein
VGQGVVFNLGIELGVKDLEVDFGEGLLLSGEDILRVESVDDGKPEIGFECGEGDDDEFDGRCLG